MVAPNHNKAPEWGLCPLSAICDGGEMWVRHWARGRGGTEGTEGQ